MSSKRCIVCCCVYSEKTCPACFEYYSPEHRAKILDNIWLEKYSGPSSDKQEINAKLRDQLRFLISTMQKEQGKAFTLKNVYGLILDAEDRGSTNMCRMHCLEANIDIPNPNPNMVHMPNVIPKLLLDHVLSTPRTYSFMNLDYTSTFFGTAECSPARDLEKIFELGRLGLPNCTSLLFIQVSHVRNAKHLEDWLPDKAIERYHLVMELIVTAGKRHGYHLMLQTYGSTIYKPMHVYCFHVTRSKHIHPQAMATYFEMKTMPTVDITPSHRTKRKREDDSQLQQTPKKLHPHPHPHPLFNVFEKNKLIFQAIPLEKGKWTLSQHINKEKTITAKCHREYSDEVKTETFTKAKKDPKTGLEQVIGNKKWNHGVEHRCWLDYLLGNIRFDQHGNILNDLGEVIEYVGFVKPW